MTPTIVQQAAEYAAIHLAVCRYRKQSLRCSTCSDLAERCRPKDDICAPLGAEKLARRFALAEAA